MMWILWLIASIICYIIYTWRVYAPKTIWETLIIGLLCINPITFFMAALLKGAGNDNETKIERAKAIGKPVMFKGVIE